MFDGSLATRGPWQALVTFQQLLILSDRFGHVDMTLDSIHRRTTVPLDVLETGIVELLKPDPDSRRPDEEGRRIVPLDPGRNWGWRITNHQHYRQIRSAEERRNYQREYMRDYRKGTKRGARKPAKPSARGNGTDAAPVVPEWIDAALFASWIKIRPAKARTADAQAAAIAKLDKFRAQGLDVNAILQESLANGWQGIFAPDAKKNAPASVPVNGARCHYCAQPATKRTNEIPHCERLDHLDMAIARRQ